MCKYKKIAECLKAGNKDDYVKAIEEVARIIPGDEYRQWLRESVDQMLDDLKYRLQQYSVDLLTELLKTTLASPYLEYPQLKEHDIKILNHIPNIKLLVFEINEDSVRLLEDLDPKKVLLKHHTSVEPPTGVIGITTVHCRRPSAFLMSQIADVFYVEEVVERFMCFIMAVLLCDDGNSPTPTSPLLGYSDLFFPDPFLKFMNFFYSTSPGSYSGLGDTWPQSLADQRLNITPGNSSRINDTYRQLRRKYASDKVLYYRFCDCFAKRKYDQMLDLCIIIEALFLNEDDRQEIRRRFSQRAAVFADKYLSPSDQWLQKFKALYDFRSGVVHSADSSMQDLIERWGRGTLDEMEKELIGFTKIAIRKIILEDFDVIQLEEVINARLCNKPDPF